MSCEDVLCSLFHFFPRCFECQVVGVDLMVLWSVDWIYPEFSGSRFNPQPAGTTRYRWATTKGFYAAIGWAFHHLSFVNSTLSNRYNYVVSGELLPLYASVQD